MIIVQSRISVRQSGNKSLLRSKGHELECYTRHNDVISTMGRLALAGGTVWNKISYRAARDLLRQKRPDIAHFHNTFPLISPAAYYAARSLKVPVVQTLHNYRLLCPNAFFFRDGQPCEDCPGRAWPWPAIYRGCYRGSRPATAVVTAMLAAHRVLGTWQEKVDVYVVLTEFARLKFIAGGLPESRVVVKPNFVHPDPGLGILCQGHTGNLLAL